MPASPALGDRFRSPVAVGTLLLVQAVAVIAYAAFWLTGGAHESDVLIELEWISFFTLPLLWLTLLLPGVWLWRQPLSHGLALAVRGGVLLTAACGCLALAVAAFFTFLIVSWPSDF